jgi:hypothetical protein
MHREIGVIMLSSGLLIPLITTNITNALNIQTVQIFNGQIGLYPSRKVIHFMYLLVLKIYLLREPFLHPEEHLKV